MSSKSGAIRAGRAFVELFADRTHLTRGLKRAKGQLRAFGAYAKRLSFGIAGEVSRLFAALLPAGVLAIFTMASKKFVEMGDRIHKAALRTGVSAKALSALGHAAEQSGSNLDQLVDGIVKMQDFLYKASRGGVSETKTLQQLGLTIRDLARLSPDEQFRKLAESLSRVHDPAVRSALAMRIFSEGGKNLLPMLADGAKGIDALTAEAERLGLVISQQDANAAAAQGDAFARMTKAASAAAFKLGAALAPAIIKVIDTLTGGIVIIGKWIQRNKGLIRMIAIVGAAIAAATISILLMGVSLAIVGGIITGITALFGALGAAAGFVSSLFFALAGSPLGLALVALSAGLATLTAWAIKSGTALDWLRTTFGPLLETAWIVFDAIQKALASGDWAVAAEVAWATLHLAWVKGTESLMAAWQIFKKGATDTFIQLSGDLSRIWVETIDFLADAWSTFLTGFRKSWIDAYTWIGNRFIELTLSPEEAEEQKRINQQIADEQKNQLDRERNQEIGNRDQDRKKQLREIAEAQRGAKAASDAMFAAQVSGSSAELKKAREAFEEAIAKARGLPALPGSPDALQLPGNMTSLLSGGGAAGNSGTFSSEASRMYHSENPIYRYGDRVLRQLMGINQGVEHINDVDP